MALRFLSTVLRFLQGWRSRRRGRTPGELMRTTPAFFSRDLLELRLLWSRRAGTGAMRTGQILARSRVGLGVALGLLAITTAACADEALNARGALGDRETSDTSAAASSTEAPTTTTTEAPTTTTDPPTTTTTEPSVVESGTYVVPDQFAPGTYRVEGHWARLDAAQEIIDNDLVDSGLTLTNVAPTDAYVEINGAAIALVDLPQVDRIAAGWTDGTYLVGTDIAPGRYNVTSAGFSAYFARLDANLEIINNNRGHRAPVST
jgi:hypothetical protein